MKLPEIWEKVIEQDTKYMEKTEITFLSTQRFKKPKNLMLDHNSHMTHKKNKIKFIYFFPVYHMCINEY